MEKIKVSDKIKVSRTFASPLRFLTVPFPDAHYVNLALATESGLIVSRDKASRRAFNAATYSGSREG